VKKIGNQFDDIVRTLKYKDKYDSGADLWAYDRQIETAANFLCDETSINNKVLDIGSGIGRFCILAAKLHPNFQFEGIELDSKRVHISNLIAEEMDVKNVKFICGDFRDLDVAEYGGFFIYSPFRMGAAHELNVTPRNWNYDNVIKYVNEMNEITAHKLSATSSGTKYAIYDGAHSLKVPKGFKTPEGNEWSPYYIKQ
jgi:SAM-dependent methyltransferase